MERRQLAEAVTERDVGLDAEPAQKREPGEGRGHDRWLREGGLDRIRDRLELRLRVEVADEAEATRQHAAVHRGAGALAREEKADPGGRAGADRNAGPGVDEPLGALLERRLERIEGAVELVGTGGDGGGPHVSAPLGQARVQSCGEIAELREAERARGRSHGGDLLGHVDAGPCEEEELRVLRRAREPALPVPERAPAPRRHPLQHDVRVDPAEAHRADGCPRRRPGRPRLRLARDSEGRARAAQLRVRLDAGRRRRHDLLAQAQRSLDQPCDPGRGLRVPDVRLERADRSRAARSRLSAGLRERRELGRIPDLRPGPVALEQRDGVDPEPRALVGAAEREQLSLELGARDPADAVRGDSPPPDRDHRGLVLEPAEDDEPAALPWPEALGALVVHPHVVGCEGAGLREADQLERVEAEVDAAGDDDVRVPALERRRAGRDGEERRSTGAVDGVAAALQVECVADAAGDRVREAAGERVLVDLVEGRLEVPLELGQETRAVGLGETLAGQGGRDDSTHVRPAQAERARARELAREGVPDDDERPLAIEPRSVGVSGAREGLGGDLEREPVREIGRPVGAAGDAEADAVEVPPLEHGRLERVRAIGRGRVGREVVLHPEPLGGQAPKGPALREDVAPQLVGRVGVRVAARHADDRDSVHQAARTGTAAGTCAARRTASRYSPAPRQTPARVRAKKSPNTTWNATRRP